MANTLGEAKITTRSARSRLAEGVHWREIDSGAHIHLGYRKGATGGRWLVRWYAGDQRYRQRTLCAADDAIDADGVKVLTYAQAERAAKQAVVDENERAALEAAGPVVTVRMAVESYIEARDAREETRTAGKACSSANRLRWYVLSDTKLADTPVAKLTTRDLRKWRAALATATSAPSRARKIPGKPIGPSTVQRLTNDFRAALTTATDEMDDETARAIVIGGLRAPKVTTSAAPTAREGQVLTDAQVRSLLTACASIDEDFHRLVLVLAATGARFAQVRRLTVGDVLDTGRLMVPASFKGRSGSTGKPPIAVPIGADVLEALRPVVEGRADADPLLERWTHRQTAPMVWERQERGPWNTASEMTKRWDKACTMAGLPQTTVPYALRHSSIVRNIRANLPVRLVAALHDTSIAMIERHYARYITDSLDEMAARAIVPMVAQ